MGIKDTLDTIVSYIRKSRDPELLDQVISLQSAYMDLQSRIHELEAENRALKKARELKESIVVEHGVYFLDKDSGKDGPFCTVCWDTKQQLVRLMVYDSESAYCHACETGYDYLSTGQQSFTIRPR